MESTAHMPASRLVFKISACFILIAVIELIVVWLINEPLIITITTLFLTALGIGLTIFFLKPLTQLQRQLNSLAQNNYQPLPITSGEIGQLATSINSLLTIIRSSTGKLLQDQNALSSTKLKLESILNAVDDGVIALDFNNRVIMMNTTAERLTGYKISQLQDQPLEQFVTFQNNDGIKTHLDKLCQPQDNLQPVNPINIIGPNHHQEAVKISCSMIKSTTPTNLKCILILHDVGKEVALQGIQIDFVSMASHELRTPLTSILGYLSVFMDENKTKLSQEQLDFLDRIMISAKQLGTLIENLLNVSKVERNAFSVTTQSVNWTQTLTKAVEDNRLAATQKNITLTLVPLDPQLPNAAADPVRIVEVINNLISNAINYTKQGGKIEVGAKAEKEEIITYVKDTGVGIPKEALQHLFTKFFRVQGALDKASNSKGTGLGLYLSKSIIDLHHGRIWVESEVGQGSTFYFTVPVSSQQLPPGLTLPSQKA